MTTVGEKFRSQLTKLMETVAKTNPFFIRCIKPNQAKRPRVFDAKMAVEQLTYAGVFEAVKIRKQGFPFRRPHAEFNAMYKWIARRASGWARIDADPRASPGECAAALAPVYQRDHLECALVRNSPLAYPSSSSTPLARPQASTRRPYCLRFTRTSPRCGSAGRVSYTVPKSIESSSC